MTPFEVIFVNNVQLSSQIRLSVYRYPIVPTSSVEKTTSSIELPWPLCQIYFYSELVIWLGIHPKNIY